jgi:hypothetical protein
MGVVSVIGGISGLRLPETLHQRLPQTIEEGELFGRDWMDKDCFCFKPSRHVYNHRFENNRFIILILLLLDILFIIYL